MNRKMRIFISHLHGDHVFGLPGLLHSLSFMGRTQELEIYGPKGIADFVLSVNKVVKLYSRFPIRIREIQSSGRIVDDVEYEVRAAPAKHSIQCFAYSFHEKPKPGRFDPKKARQLGVPEGPLWKKLQVSKFIRIGKRRISSRSVVGPARPGVKITYAVDTRPCTSVTRLANRSDLLIHDSCFNASIAEKAKAYGHSTSIEAAQIAKRSKSSKLVLFHISAMYEDASPLLREAKRVFPQTVLCEDMDTLEVG
jgi:ribonuclease Z